MTYKETLFFVAKCLTINHEAHNKRIVEEVLQSDAIDWDEVVKLSTAHYVFPALYCNLKRASFLSYLPEDLVEYMKYITELNRERNEEIIAQAKELNTLLLEHDITPIFLKGTGNLLEGLYEDIGERMVGDIDFICSPEDYPRAIELLKDNGYPRDFEKPIYPGVRHYPRLIHENKIAVLELHKELLIEKYSSEFNFNFIKKNCLITNNFSVLSFENQLSLSIAATQINDSGFEYKNVALRNAYDVLLLSKKTNAKNAFKKFNRLQHPLHCFLASCFEVFNKPKTLQYTSSKKIEKYLLIFYKYLNDNNLYNNNYKKILKKKGVIHRFTIIYKSFFYKEYRVWLFRRITDKNWQKEKLVQLGIKKP